MEKIKILSILMTLGVLVIIALTIRLASIKMVEANMEIQCCNGTACSDTYYTPKDNLCHLSLCEQQLFQFNKSKCVYPGANISVNYTNELNKLIENEARKSMWISKNVM